MTTANNQANIWNPGVDKISVNANTTVITQVFAATAGQQVFTLTAFEYVVGTGSLLVFKSGKLLRPSLIAESAVDSFTYGLTDAYEGEEFLAVGFVGISADAVDLSGPFSHSNSYPAGSVGAKLKLTVNLADAPYNAVAGTDIADILQTALDAPGVTEIVIPTAAYNWSKKVINRRPRVVIRSENYGVFSAYTTSFTCTAASTIDSMLEVANGMIGCGLKGNFKFDGASKSDMCYHVVANSGSATHFPFIDSISVSGYKKIGIMLGDPDLATLCWGQMSTVRMGTVNCMGGDVDAIGIAVNAQNCEVLDIESLTCISLTHKHHVYARAGGVHIKNFVSTKSTDYATMCMGSQVIIDLWRSEDRYLIYGWGVASEGPCAFKNILHRASPVAWNDATIDWGNAGLVNFENISIQGNLVIEPSLAKRINASVFFANSASGSGYVVYGPSNLTGSLENLSTGNVELYGSAAKIQANDTSGNPLFSCSSTSRTNGYREETFGTAAPISGYHRAGDICWNTAPSSGGYIGWTCSVTGTPGTWKTFGSVS